MPISSVVADEGIDVSLRLTPLRYNESSWSNTLIGISLYERSMASSWSHSECVMRRRVSNALLSHIACRSRMTRHFLRMTTVVKAKGSGMALSCTLED